MTSNNRKSSFMKALGRYRTPRPGETLPTPYGKAVILRVLTCDEVVDEMKRDGVPGDEIAAFDARVSHFLGDKRKYFEAEVAYPEGELERIDWSEYLGLRNKRRQ
jgi:hypothetical protein